MDIIQELLNNTVFINIIKSLITIIVAYIFYTTIATILTKNIEGTKTKIKENKKAKTYVKLIRSITRYIFIALTIIVLLEINGVNISSMLAGVGIISIIVGFAIQDALKDIIKGFDILSDSYYRVGDVIKYDDITGKVLVIGLKTTKVEDIYTFNIVSISNRNIEKVEVVSNLINIDIPLPYELKTKDAEEVIEKILEKIRNHQGVDKAEYRGVNELGESAIKYQIKVYCEPILKVQTRRDALGYIIKTLEENNISVPYNQLDIHNK